MVKHLVSIGIVGGVAAVSACLAEGPTPTVPSGATILVTAQPGQDCNSGTYIGPVAFGSDHGYVTFLSYQAIGDSCNGGGGGGQIQAPEDVYSFLLGGGGLQKVGSAGTAQQGSHVQLTAFGPGVAYAYTLTGMNTITVEPANVMLGSNMGTELPLGIFTAGSNLYVAAVSNLNTTGGRDTEDPNFPNSGTIQFNGGASGTIWPVGSNATPRTWTASCGSLDRCIVANDTSFTYVSNNQSGGTGPWTILQVPFAGTTPLEIAKAPVSGGGVPLGLDVDSHQVAWSITDSCTQNMSGGSFNCQMRSCNVFDYDTAAAMPKATTLLSTQQFACVDAKLANGYVYFAIVEVSTNNNRLMGRGIGRVSIADRSIETLDLGTRTPTYGVRRIFPIGDQLYLVDPFVIARIPASALDGKHDFTP